MTVAHEIQHTFGREHAGSACEAPKGQEGIDWPPDHRGLLAGIGIDTRAGSGGASGPFAIHAAGLVFNGFPEEIFDLMSYCRNNTVLRGQWISPRGWGEVLNYRRGDVASASAAGPTIAQTSQAGTSMLSVTAVETIDGRIAVRASHPTAEPGPAAPADSPFVLEARDDAGNILSTIPAAANATSEGGFVIDGVVTIPAGTTQVVVRHGNVAGQVLASPNHPAVRLLAPKPGSRQGAKTVAVRWKATDADGPAAGPLSVEVEYSPKGNAFEPIYTGPPKPGRRRSRGRCLPGRRMHGCV